MIGQDIYNFAAEIFPICRSITGNGVRETLKAINKVVDGHLNVIEVPSGTPVFDWTVPNEWNIRDAYIEDSKGNKIVDFKKSNLHVLGYSTPVDTYVSLEELKKIVYTSEDQPDVIPYVTSYYKERYGFCMSYNQLQSLKEDTYHIVIDSSLEPGSLSYGEILIPGKSKKEIFLSAYTCHPSMANNECSGPSVLAYIAKELLNWSELEYSYRIIFIPETIGSITYLSRNLKTMQDNIIAGFNLTCVGDNNNYSYIPSINGDTLADKVALNVFQTGDYSFKKYTFMDCGSDGRRYNAPNVDLPVIELCRTKYWDFPEYHTSKDDMTFISPEGLFGAYEVVLKMIEALECNKTYLVTTICEPQLGKRGLYPTISRKDNVNNVNTIRNFVSYTNGKRDLIEISNILNVPVSDLNQIAKKLIENDLLECIENSSCK